MELPDPEKTPLNRVSLDELRRQRERTGLGSHAIVKHFGHTKDAPTPAMIENWLSGNQAFAKRSHYQLVLETYARQPDLGPDGINSSYVAVTDALRAELRQIHCQCASGYLRAAPHRFSASQMTHLLQGRRKKLSMELLQFFRNDARNVKPLPKPAPYPPVPDLGDVGQLPTRPPRKYGRRVLPKGITYIDITAELHTQLHDEIARTRVSPRRLLRSLPDLPDGLNPQMVRNWHSGKIQSAEPHYVEFVMKAYRALPSA